MVNSFGFIDFFFFPYDGGIDHYYYSTNAIQLTVTCTPHKAIVFFTIYIKYKDIKVLVIFF